MSDFKAKMHEIRFLLEFSPRPRRGSLQRSPRNPCCIYRQAGERKGEGKRRVGEGEREGRIAPNLLFFVRTTFAVLLVQQIWIRRALKCALCTDLASHYDACSVR